VAVTFDKFLDEFPQANISALQTKESKGQALAWVTSSSRTTYAADVDRTSMSSMMRGATTERFATNEMSIVGRYMRDRDTLVATTKRGSEKGHFHEVDTTKPMEYIVSHEFAHVLDFTLRRAGKKLETFKLRSEYLERTW
jgi:hypothetical protein